MFDSGFGDFFRQLPAIFVIMFCGSSIALVVVLAVIINARGRRARAVDAVAVPVTVASTTVGSPPPSGGSGGDLPDLDSLLNVDPSAPRPAQRGTFILKTTAGESIEAVEVMTILRDVAEGGLIIQIGDKVFRNPPALADAEFKRRFNSTVRDLYQSIGDTSLSTKATGEMTTAEVEPSSALPPVMPPPPVPGAPAPGDLPKFKLPDFQEKPKRGRKGPAEPIPEINIAGAIEEYLQYKLAMTPQFARRYLHVRPSVGGGLRIDVDDKSYETVGDVEDTAIRDFLQATIEEWQSRQ